MAAYFRKCKEKLGFVPNVLKAYAFDMAKLEAFVAMYNDLMLGAVGPEQDRARDDRGRGVLAEPLLLLPGRARRRGAAIFRRSGARRIDGDELSRGAIAEAPARHARFRGEADKPALGVEDGDRERLRRAGFSDRDIWDISAIVGFFNMSNRVASATDMRPNSVYHAMARI